MKNPKLAELLKTAREKSGPSPWDVGVRGQHTNGAEQLPFEMTAAQSDDSQEGSPL